jgi:hypothetical protein
MNKNELIEILKTTSFYKYFLFDDDCVFRQIGMSELECEWISDIKKMSNDDILKSLSGIIDNYANSYLLYGEASEYIHKHDRSLLRSKNLLIEKELTLESIESPILASLLIKDNLKKEIKDKLLTTTAKAAKQGE